MAWRHGDISLRPGQFGVVPTTEPVQVRVSRRARTQTLFLPREILDRFGPATDVPAARTLQANPAFHLLLRHLKHTMQLGQSLDADASVAAILAASELLAAALSSAHPESAACHDTIRIAQVKDYIDLSLDTPSLSVAEVAAANFVSPRTVQRLFTATGETASAYIRRRRLEMCKADILAHPTMPIAEVCQRRACRTASPLARPVSRALRRLPAADPRPGHQRAHGRRNRSQTARRLTPRQPQAEAVRAGRSRSARSVDIGESPSSTHVLDLAESRAEFRVKHFWDAITVRGTYERMTVLPGDDGLRAAAVEPGIPDGAAAGTGPVEVAAVHRHPLRGVLPGDDGVRAAAVEPGFPDAPSSVDGPVQVAAVHGHPGGEVLPGDDGVRAAAVQGLPIPTVSGRAAAGAGPVEVARVNGHPEGCSAR